VAATVVVKEAAARVAVAKVAVAREIPATNLRRYAFFFPLRAQA
jgi:hypothetical protein